jgi:hypothetical protein
MVEKFEYVRDNVARFGRNYELGKLSRVFRSVLQKKRVVEVTLNKHWHVGSKR